MPRPPATPARRRGRPPKLDGTTPDTRERLLEAAFASLLELGYDGVTLADVAKRAGVTANAVYHHFDGRSALMVAAAKRALDAVQWPAVLPATEASERARMAVRAFLRPEAAGFRRFILELHAAASRDPELAPLLEDWNAASLANWLRLTGRSQEAKARIKAFFLLVMGTCHLEQYGALGTNHRLVIAALEDAAAGLFADL
ncbi:MAG: TetR/AcrR family transcriptional regulator [Ilumatobacteraceae bacterium]|nr:TetR/AcrR family transcriptional regulator [Ilumatobacter sp.]MCB0985062.1 TetR/AcrR family transcriptional regulator [Ilumatobacter sp.]MCB9380738.1 TetR/AcrR family transcriptional regulator [Acidimicrobiaceae bacterium]